MQKESKFPKYQSARFYIVALLLLAVGIAIGWLVFGAPRGNIERIGFTSEQCGDLSSQILYSSADDAEKIKIFKEVYSENCAGRFAKIKIPKPKLERTSEPEEKLSQENCVAVEKVLKQRIYIGDDSTDPDHYTDRAQVYANLVVRGCPENADGYKKLALRDIEIAQALRDGYYRDYEIKRIIDTYKKLNMKAEAERMFENMKKLTSPAVDFILQVEKIFEDWK
ncbi:MAG: hypothetical protein LBF28_01690 [Rickettsiales bacterium]|jgi:hypothetical protein|nr:hypothetical protein [Rickettsiales bacterium]